MSRNHQRPNLGLVDAPPNDHVEEYVVEKILGKRFVNGRPQVLVKWSGFPNENNTWEPLENVGNCMKLVSDFESEVFRLHRKAAAKSVGKSKSSPSSSGPLITENGPSSSKKTQQHSKSVQAKNTSGMSKMDQKKGKNIKKTARKIKDIENYPKTQMPSTSQVSTDSTEVFDGNPSATTTNMIKSPRIQSLFSDLNLIEPTKDKDVGDTSLKTPPKSRRLIEFPQREDAPLSSKHVSPMLIRKESQPLQSSCTDDSDLGESSSSMSLPTVSSTSSEKSIKVTKSEPKTLGQIKFSSRSSDGGHAASSLGAPKEGDIGLDLSGSDSMDSEVESMRRCPRRKRKKTYPNWKFPEITKPFGVNRGLDLDEILHCYQMNDDLFMFVTWKGCSSIDAVHINDIKEAYPLQIIKYFESLRIIVPK
uniref:Rhino n=1 Tax=Drosophila melanogaster TaxID=7227 RepID=Q49BK7_DROME|nr:rhino [Drosophila melanogaster]